jgi:hypothetical protein
MQFYAVGGTFESIPKSQKKAPGVPGLSRGQEFDLGMDVA